MIFKNQISITADSGVGSTTTSRKFIEHVGISPWRWVNAGAIMRELAKERGMTIDEFNAYSLSHPEEKVDELCDNMIRHFAEHDYVVFEGRLVHYFAPSAFHVLLVCPPEVRAVRRAKDFPGITEKEIFKKIKVRDSINKERYSKIYGRDVLWEESKFDLVLDTNEFTPDEIVRKIIETHKEWISGISG